ncbi:BPSS1780 family membrane protein [Solimicrobium silvestre]|uniref:Transmembrane protein n=1 Tax=Solimicrobium silvestre TaxID=2099400 RepID=A0A2S9H142_9BURK|nr:BPSS1780 family membrane protein [Solimicrobium silvestre]PRC93663.1 hypothetical protein S2091_1664 [Solimicrobium silvestre]
MNKLPANTGWLWVKQGYQYFKQQPMEFSLLFLSYLFSVLILGFIPFLGQLLAFIFLPLFTLSFMQACREIDQGARVHPRLLLFGFRSPQVVKLLQLGMLYLIAAVTALGASTLIDDGVLWQVVTGQMELTAKNVEGTNMSAAMLFAMLIYIPALLAFWFAGPLIAWQQMPLFKAIFYSFIASVRAARAFFVYGIAWFAVGGILPTICSVLIAAIIGNPNMIFMIVMPLSMVLTIILYCSFYPSYKSIFGQADAIESSTIS